MSTEDNKAIIRRQYEEAVNKQKLDLLDELIGPDYVSHDPTSPEPIRGVEGLKEYARGYFTAFPDLQFTIEEQIAEGDMVVLDDPEWPEPLRYREIGQVVSVAPRRDAALLAHVVVQPRRTLTKLPQVMIMVREDAGFRTAAGQ